MRPKYAALALLGAVSLVGPILEVAFTGSVEPYGKFELGETIVSVALIFWWYHLDKHEHNYEAGPLMNAGMVALTLVAMPIYLIRSRGWKSGGIATAIAAAVLGITFALGELGERIGAALTS
jgi:hypothetical protein